MGNVVVFIGASLDGFIAARDDDVAWLEAFLTPDEDYGFSEAICGVGTAVMGARTYEQALEHPERMLSGIKTYVVSRRVMPVPPVARVEFYQGDLKGLIGKIRQEDPRDIYVVGGGRLVSSLLREGLVDVLIQSVVPVLLGDGIPLYTGISERIGLDLIDCVRYASGVVKLEYRPKKH